ncbi:DUF5662 family protein [Lachnobacterium bovis]|uniref:DUF5662 family protein n=1 Tax=Lachnobacterium bovis TaxID=140626 RepID=UPI0003B3476E|nr:DUF5662 family protein [Lachnobacterium bovis]
MNIIKHFKTITKHKILVMKGCFKLGLIKQGLLHDLSKYGLTEFMVGAKYYKGYMSPNNAERLDKGYSSAWLHHKGRNKHHLEYWIDYNVSKDPREGKMVGMKMPVKYVVEMFVDRISASKNYLKDKYNDKSALDYYERGKSHYLINEDTASLLEFMLYMNYKKGEQYTFKYIKHNILTGKIEYNKKTLDELKSRL